MKLNQYLNKIEQGKTINLDSFIVHLPFSDPLEWRNIYQAQRVPGGYCLTIIDADRHQALYRPDVQDRVGAANRGRSHDLSSSYAHILVLNHHCNSMIPFAVVSDVDEFKTAGRLIGKQAVIVENIENFYRYREFLSAIERSELADSCDIFFGSGNQICDRLNLPFLTGYEAIYCAQDLDLGGLTIYQTLKKSLPQSVWLAPPDWQAHKDKFRLAPKNAAQLAKAITLARNLGLIQEADLMNQTRAFLEQEALLPALPQD